MLVSKQALNEIEKFYCSEIKFYKMYASDYRDTSLVEKWHFSFANGENLFLYLKQYRKDYYSNFSEICLKEFELANKFKNIFDGVDYFNVVIPIFAIPCEGVLVSEEAVGTDVFSLSLSLSNRYFKIEFLKNIYRLSGQGLNIFHDEYKEVGTFCFDEYISYVDVRLRKLIELGTPYFNEADANTIKGYISEQKKALNGISVMTSMIHGDYIPPNLIYNQGKIYLLDFLQCRHGAIIDEICYFLVFCHVQSSLLGGKYWTSLAQEFVSGYGQSVKTAELPLAHLFYLKHLLNYLLRTSYWFQSGELGSIKSRYHIIRFRILKQKVLSHCLSNAPSPSIGGVKVNVSKN